MFNSLLTPFKSSFISKAVCIVRVFPFNVVSTPSKHVTVHSPTRLACSLIGSRAPGRITGDNEANAECSTRSDCRLAIHSLSVGIMGHPAHRITHHTSHHTSHRTPQNIRPSQHLQRLSPEYCIKYKQIIICMDQNFNYGSSI